MTKKTQKYVTHFLNCRPLNLPKVLMQTGQSQAPQWSRWERIMSNSQEVTAAGRCRCPPPPQQTTTRKTLQRRTHLATVVCTCQVRNAYLQFCPSSSGVKNRILFFCLFLYLSAYKQTDPDRDTQYTHKS